jgi:hypothetical protein
MINFPEHLALLCNLRCSRKLIIAVMTARSLDERWPPRPRHARTREVARKVALPHQQ